MKVFHMFYDKVHAEVQDNTLRFALALVDSVQPIVDKEAMEVWVKRYGGKANGCHHG